MPRVRKGAARRKAKKRLFKEVKGYRGARSKNWRLAQEAWAKAQINATKDRRRKKRDMRGLWIIRLSAACRSRGIRYGQFIHGLKLAQVGLNRKMLSEMAIHDPEGFNQVVETSQKAIANST
jgi:large subunit ribosomal protein L20